MSHLATPSSSMMYRVRLPAAVISEAKLRPEKDASRSPLFFDSRQERSREIQGPVSTNSQWKSSRHKHTSVLLGGNGQSRHLRLNQLSTYSIRPHPLVDQHQSPLFLRLRPRGLLLRRLLLPCQHGPEHPRGRYPLFPKKPLPRLIGTAPKQQTLTNEVTTQQPMRASQQPSQCSPTNTQSP